MLANIVGFVATALTLSSFAVDNQLKFRFLNFSGALVWVLYGGIVDSAPVLLINIIIIVLHTEWLYYNWWK